MTTVERSPTTDQGRRVPLWITWEIQRRNRTLSEAIGAQLRELDINLPRPMRYPLALARTLWYLLRYRPPVLVVQNPSLVLALFAVVYGRLFALPVVMDAHNGGLFPLEGKYGWLNRLANWVVRHAAVTVVSNPRLVNHVRRCGGSPMVVPDPVPEFGLIPERMPCDVPPGTETKVLFVCTWMADEPYGEVAAAAELLGNGTVIYATGNADKARKLLGGNRAANFVLTGFLAEEEYVAMLHHCDVVLVLTTRENCLLCGAYEAVAAAKPLVVSDTKALREFFSAGTLYCRNTARDIAAKIACASQRRDDLAAEMARLRSLLKQQVGIAVREMEKSIHGLVHSC